jgi:hypothetical protein
MLQIEIDTEAGASPPEAFHSDRLQPRAAIPGQRASGGAPLRQRDQVAAGAPQESVREQ